MALPDLPDFLSDRWKSVGQPHSCSRSLGSRDVIKPHHAVLELARWAVTPTSPLRNHFPGRYPKALGRPSVCLSVCRQSRAVTPRESWAGSVSHGTNIVNPLCYLIQEVWASLYTRRLRTSFALFVAVLCTSRVTRYHMSLDNRVL